ECTRYPLTTTVLCHPETRHLCPHEGSLLETSQRVHTDHLLAPERHSRERVARGFFAASLHHAAIDELPRLVEMERIGFRRHRGKKCHESSDRGEVAIVQGPKRDRCAGSALAPSVTCRRRVGLCSQRR